MQVSITFYNNSSDKRSAVKNLTNAYTLTGDLVTPISFKNPTIRCQMDSIPNYNYAYIRDTDRYYFITDKECVADGIWDITFLRDSLSSFWDKIRNLTAKISRNASDFNDNIPDSKCIQSSIKSITEIPVSIVIGTSQGYLPWLAVNNWSTSTSTKHFRIGITCYKYKINTSPNVMRPLFGRLNFWGTNTTMSDLSEKIISTTTTGSSIGFLESDLDMSDFLQSISYMPIAPSSPDLVTEMQFRKSWLGTILGQTTVFDHIIDTSQIGLATDTSIIDLNHTYKSAWKISVPQILSSVTYIDAYPYTTVKIRLQPFGEATFDLSKYINDEAIYFEVEEDSVTGDAILYIRGCSEDGSTPVLGPREILAEGNVKVDLPTYSLFNESLAKVANLGNIASNVSGLAFGGLRLALGDPTGGFSIGQSIGDVVKDGIDLAASGSPVSTKGGNGSQLQDQIPTVIIISNELVLPSASLEGLPLHESRILSNVHGYTEVESIILNNLDTALPDELDEIEYILRTGVILP